MKKGLLLLGLLALSSFSSITNVFASDTFKATLEGGVKVSYSNSNTDLRATLLLKPNVTNDFSGEGISFRIKNHITSGNGSPLFIFLNETDSDRVQAGIGELNNYYLYSLDGTKESKNYREGDKAIILPASFDGYIYLPYQSFGLVNGYGNGNGAFSYDSVYGMYLEVNTFYDAFSSYSLGGLEVLNNNISNIVLDSKLLNDYTYTNYYCKDYNGKYINIEHESVGGGDISSDIDYSQAKLNGKLDKGLQVSYIGAESDIVSQFGIVPTIKNYGDDCLSLSFRIKNHTSISTPITIGVKNIKGTTYQVNKSVKKNIFFKTNDNIISINSWRDWDSAVVIPALFDGYMIIPFDLFNTVTAADKTDVRSIVFSTSVFKNYDAFTILTFGDIDIIKKDSSTLKLVNPSLLSNEEFASTYVKNLNEEYIRFTRYEEESLIAAREGDVKYLETFSHVKDDTELNKEFPVWTGGSKFTTSLVDTYNNKKGMQVDIGEVIPNNNIYGSINVFPKYYTSDWNNWSDGGVNHDQKAEGITCYLKNLSRKEIIMNLEFDEITKKNNKNITERWNVQLGAMIMYYDINTNQEFIRMAKPAIVIPIGFEGYIRIAFEQYSVPSWCTDGDLFLDVSQNMAGMYITSDCSNNEGLSFVISDCGIYYNKTQISSFFEESENSIKNNMGRNK